MSTLADNVRRAIEKLGVEALMTSTGLSRATLYNIAGGATPSVGTLRKLKAGSISIPKNLLSA